MPTRQPLGILLLVAAALLAIAGLDDLSINRNNWATLFDYAALLGAVVLALLGAVLLAVPPSSKRLMRTKRTGAKESVSPVASLGGTLVGGASVYAALDALRQGVIFGGRIAGLVTFQAHPFSFLLRVGFLLAIGALLLWLFLPGALRMFGSRDDE